MNAIKFLITFAISVTFVSCGINSTNFSKQKFTNLKPLPSTEETQLIATAKEDELLNQFTAIRNLPELEVIEITTDSLSPLIYTTYSEEINLGIELKTPFYIKVGSLEYELQNPNYNDTTGVLSGDLIRLQTEKSRELRFEINAESYDIVKGNSVQISGSQINKLGIWGSKKSALVEQLNNKAQYENAIEEQIIDRTPLSKNEKMAKRYTQGRKLFFISLVFLALVFAFLILAFAASPVFFLVMIPTYLIGYITLCFARFHFKAYKASILANGESVTSGQKLVMGLTLAGLIGFGIGLLPFVLGMIILYELW